MIGQDGIRTSDLNGHLFHESSKRCMPVAPIGTGTGNKSMWVQPQPLSYLGWTINRDFQCLTEQCPHSKPANLPYSDPALLTIVFWVGKIHHDEVNNWNFSSDICTNRLESTLRGTEKQICQEQSPFNWFNQPFYCNNNKTYIQLRYLGPVLCEQPSPPTILQQRSPLVDRSRSIR